MTRDVKGTTKSAEKFVIATISVMMMIVTESDSDVMIAAIMAEAVIMAEDVTETGMITDVIIVVMIDSTTETIDVTATAVTAMRDRGAEHATLLIKLSCSVK